MSFSGNIIRFKNSPGIQRFPPGLKGKGLPDPGPESGPGSLRVQNPTMTIAAMQMGATHFIMMG